VAADGLAELQARGYRHLFWDSGAVLGNLLASPRLRASRRGCSPAFVGPNGRRIDRHAAGRIVRRIARRAGIAKRVGPHTLRHAFITAALDAGVPLRDVQEAASHADPRTTMRYDRARVSLDRHATYIVATFLAGASR
jgi:integrase/recombinase XerD